MTKNWKSYLVLEALFAVGLLLIFLGPSDEPYESRFGTKTILMSLAGWLVQAIVCWFAICRSDTKK
jgi:hypothetical protein